MKNLIDSRAASLLTGLCLAFAGVHLASAATHNISLSGISFTPANLTVNVGDTVIFTATSGGHTVTGSGAEAFCGVQSISALGAVKTCTVTFNSAGTFPFRCNVHVALGMMGSITATSAGSPPSVSIIGPTNGAAFPAPASFTIQADANDPDNNLALVEFFEGANSLGKVTNSPFVLAVSNLVAGDYTLRARASDRTSLVSTSAPVQISLITPAELRFAPPTYRDGVFSVSLDTTPRLTYVVEASSNVSSAWTALSTNVATGNSLKVSDSDAPSRFQRFFRAFIRP